MSESDLVVSSFLLSQDVQSDAPFHILHLKVEVERSKLTMSLQECQTEVMRENRHLAGMGSERLIKEHRVRLDGVTRTEFECGSPAWEVNHLPVS